MNIIGITDIHGHHDLNKEIITAISNADLVLIAGDITNFGNENEADIIIKAISRLNNKTLAVPGNCDHLGVNEALSKHGINLHGFMKKVDNVAIYGIGGCSKTPFRTPQEYSEAEIHKILNGFDKEVTARFHIFITHSPPSKTKLDKMFLGFHVGSKAIRNFIERFQPNLVLCGHIHEARGVDRIGNSVIINPGPFPKFYVVIKINEKIDYELR